jgi:hypothetical protein
VLKVQVFISNNFEVVNGRMKVKGREGLDSEPSDHGLQTVKFT